jgi:hypothetical protein
VATMLMKPVPHAAELAALSVLPEFPPELTDVVASLMKALVQIPDVGINRVGYERGVRSGKTPARVHRCTVRRLRSSCRAILDWLVPPSARAFISLYRLYRLCLFCCLADEIELGTGGAAEATNPCMLP